MKRDMCQFGKDHINDEVILRDDGDEKGPLAHMKFDIADEVN